MTEIGFYHLLSTPLERALPSILERGLAAGHRIVVLAGSSERVEHLNDLLWTFSDESFLPHGSAREGHAERQPVWLTAEDENPNGATMLVLVDGASTSSLDRYARCCDIFDGNDELAVTAARERWKAAKAAGHQLVYWEQAGGKWERRGG